MNAATAPAGTAVNKVLDGTVSRGEQFGSGGGDSEGERPT